MDQDQNKIEIPQAQPEGTVQQNNIPQVFNANVGPQQPPSNVPQYPQYPTGYSEVNYPPQQQQQVRGIQMGQQVPEGVYQGQPVYNNNNAQQLPQVSQYRNNSQSDPMVALAMADYRYRKNFSKCFLGFFFCINIFNVIALIMFLLAQATMDDQGAYNAHQQQHGRSDRWENEDDYDDEEMKKISGISFFIDLILLGFGCFRVYLYYHMYQTLKVNQVEKLEKFMKWFVYQLGAQIFLSFIHNLADGAAGGEWLGYMFVASISISVLLLMLWYLKQFIKTVRTLVSTGVYLPEF